MSTTITTYQPQSIASSIPSLTVDTLITSVYADVASSTARVYGQTFRAWVTWCESNGVNPLELLPSNVVGFLTSQDTSKQTRARQLAALRKLAAKAHTYALLVDADLARQFEAVRRLLDDVKTPAPETSKSRSKKALSPAAADKVLRVWADDNTPAAIRNNALIAVLLFTGMRRSEVAVLTWDCVDFENGVITVQAGKGGKRRECSIAGDYAIDALQQLQMAQPADYRYLFTPMKKNRDFAGDRPITGTDVYRVIKATEKASGIEFKPHDLRRTFITEALSIGVPVHEVQAAAGHAKGDTTLQYAQTTGARERRKLLKFRFG